MLAFPKCIVLAKGLEPESGRAWSIGIETLVSVVVLDAKETECSFAVSTGRQGPMLSTNETVSVFRALLRLSLEESLFMRPTWK